MDSSRISLRPSKLTDVNDFPKWASDERIMRYLRLDTITSREEALTYLGKVVIRHPWRRSISLDDERSIGYVSMRPDNRCRAHISYVVGTDYRGQGIVTYISAMVTNLWVLKAELYHLFTGFWRKRRHDGKLEKIVIVYLINEFCINFKLFNIYIYI